MNNDDWKKVLGLGVYRYRDPMQELLEQQRKRQEMFDPPYERMLRKFQGEGGMLGESSALQMMQKINEALGYKYKDELDKLSGLVAPSTVLRQSLDQLQLFGLGPEDYFQRAANLSMAAERRLSHVAWESMGDLLGVSEESRSQLQSRFTKLAVSYGRLYKTDSREGREDAGEALPDEISTLPAAEVYQNVELLDAVSSDTQENEEDAPAAEQDESQILDIGQTLRLETESALERLLAEIDPDFVRLLDGAKASANSMNPDRVRHVAISLRELFTHVLHALAPTDAVEKWSSDSVHYANGKPTRRARILYVCRSISFGRFSTFLLKDVEVTLAFVDLFQGATHEVSAQVSTEQLIAMIVRMECLLRFLLETAKLAR